MHTPTRLLFALILAPAVACTTGAQEESLSDDEALSNLSIPNTTLTKYTTVFGNGQELRIPKVGLGSASAIGVLPGDSFAATIHCFLRPGDQVSASMVAIGKSGKVTTLSQQILTPSKSQMKTSKYVVKDGDQYATMINIKGSLSKQASCYSSIDGLSRGVDETFVKNLKSTYDKLTEEEFDIEQPKIFVPGSPTSLKGLAKRQFAYVNAVWGDYFEPTVVNWKVGGQSVVIVAVDHDGGGSRDLYTADGRWLASGGYGESSPYEWQ